MESLRRGKAGKCKPNAANEWRLWANKLHFDNPQIWKGHCKLMSFSVINEK